MQLICLLLACASPAEAVPSHPRELALTPRPAAPPRPEDHRARLAGGLAAYLCRDAAAPAVRLTLRFKTGAWLDPAGKEGLAEGAAALFRTGGTARLAPEELDRALEDGAIEISADAEPDAFTVSLWSLTRCMEPALRLLAEMLRSPRVDAERLAVWKAQKLQALAALHDRPDEILRLYWRDLLWGSGHVVGRRPARAAIAAIEPADIKAWLAAWLTPGNCILVATSDLPVADLAAALDAHLAGWEGAAAAWPPLPDPLPPEPPGIYVVRRDLAQCAVRLGHRSIKYGDPEHHALLVLSEALGGGSFQSRLTGRVRVQEGLTYGIASFVAPGWKFPGTVFIQFNTDASRAARALAITMEEIERLAAHGLPEDELASTVETMVARFAGAFEDLHGALAAIARLEHEGRPPDYYTTYVARLRALTRAEIAQAAKKFLKPGEIRVLIAGDPDKLREGAAKDGIALETFGPLKELPIRNPME